MSTSTDLARLLVAALRDVPGVQPARPATVPARVPWDADLMAVDIVPDLVTIRLVASRLPLPPLLAQVTAALRSALADHDLGGIRLRLEVVDLDQAAFR